MREAKTFRSLHKYKIENVHKCTYIKIISNPLSFTIQTKRVSFKHEKMFVYMQTYVFERKKKK